MTRSRDMDDMIAGWQQAALQSSDTILETKSEPEPEPDLEEEEEQAVEGVETKVIDAGKRLRNLLGRGRNRRADADGIHRK